MTTETLLPVVVRRRKGRVPVAKRLDVEIVILLGALYVAMEVQLRHAQAGRDLIEQRLPVGRIGKPGVAGAYLRFSAAGSCAPAA